jgi:AbrB family looped-hinge helix DNA binding protein
MATKARIRRKFQITIPQEVRNAYPLEEGQYVNVEATEKGILITASREIDPTQAWFWSPRWAEMERSADDDFRAGRVTETSAADAAIAALKKKNGSPKRK